MQRQRSKVDMPWNWIDLCRPPCSTQSISTVEKFRPPLNVLQMKTLAIRNRSLNIVVNSRPTECNEPVEFNQFGDDDDDDNWTRRRQHKEQRDHLCKEPSSKSFHSNVCHSNLEWIYIYNFRMKWISMGIWRFGGLFAIIFLYPFGHNR